MMEKFTLAAILKFVLTIAALFAVPVGTWVAGHEVVYAVLSFLSSLLALFIRSPLTAGDTVKPPESK